MSILIKGVKMPKSCESCPCKTADAFGGLGCQAAGYIPLRKANQDRPDWCPLVPVPPNGGLIDRDALCDRFYEDYFRFDVEAIVNYIRANAPTIIPASKEEMK